MVTLECSLNIIRVYIEWHKKLIIMFSIFMVTSEWAFHEYSLNNNPIYEPVLNCHLQIIWSLALAASENLSFPPLLCQMTPVTAVRED